MATTTSIAASNFNAEQTKLDIVNGLQKDIAQACNLISGMLAPADTALTPGAITTLANVTGTVNVPFASLGDFVMPSYDKDLLKCQLAAYVSAAGVITWVIYNPTAGTLTPANGNLSLRILPKAKFTIPVLTVTP